MIATDLKLASYTSPPRGTRRVERRRTPRHAVAATVTAMIHLPAASDQPVACRIGSLDLINVSRTGLEAVSLIEIVPGATLTIFFPRCGQNPGFHLSGRVVRCSASQHGHGYDVGVEFDQRSAA